MTSDDDLGDLLDAAPSPDRPPPDISALVPLLDAVREAVSGLASYPVKHASLEERADLVQLHDALLAIELPIRARRQSIELAFKRAAAEMGADEIRTATGVVRVTPARAEYEVDEQGLYDALRACVNDGLVTQDELDKALARILVFKPDHRQLNMLARHRGPQVQAAIDSHRSTRPSDPLSGRVDFHTKGGRP